MEEYKVIKAILGNSYLHEYWMKLVDPKMTMALQMMEKVLVPLGTPSSKHKAKKLAPEAEPKSLHHH